MANLDRVLKSRNIILLTKIHLVKAIVFPVIMYGCELGHKKTLKAKESMLLNCCVGDDA